MEGNMRCWSGSLVQAVNDDCAHFLLGHQKGTMPSRKDMKKRGGRERRQEEEGKWRRKEQKHGRRASDVGTVDERYVRYM